jgi:hypothetical protein
LANSYATVLGVSRTLIRVLRILNLLMGLAMVVAVPASFVFAPLFREFFSKLPPRIDPGWLLPTLRLWLVLAVGMVAATQVLLSRLLAIVDSVRAGDPFVAGNAARLNTIAWCMLALQLLRLTFGGMAGAMNAAGSNIEFKLSLGDLLTGWLTVLLAFVLARVFAEGARIRADLEAMI